ncbi:hypothetical protein P692DRAFT_201849319 [Suillus brevipes Sb2]|nr:hypothetical protein P692DRAFT_201849319 [Suillus brevipes Sb2]
MCNQYPAGVFLPVVMPNLRHLMSTSALKRGCCAICAHNVLASELVLVDVALVPLHLLRNDCLPDYTLPSNYDFELYARAILYSKGLTDCWTLSDIFMCPSCHSYLICKSPQQPVNSLANFQYYGHHRLPADIQDAFSSASIYDLMLVTHFYTYKPSSNQFWSAEEASQRYNKGNVAIRPQNSTELRNLLPPSPDELQDAMCTPSRDTVKQMRPVLVTKSRVEKLIHFLIANNPWYQHSGVAYSQSNMDALFDQTDLAVCHLPSSENELPIDEGFSLRDLNHNQSGQVDLADIVMEPIGYTEGDHSSQSREKMKLHALAYVLDRGEFIADNDPGLMSYLFPHLDPWDIGGFYHTGRTVPQYISMQAQIKNLLRQDDSLFRSDPHFAFVEVSRNTTFRTSLSTQRGLAKGLRDWRQSVNYKPCSIEEKRAVKILRQLQASTRSVRGSIRSLMRKYCTPAFGVVPSIVDIDIDEWSTMSSFERAKVIASRPDAAALAFDMQIRAFINVVLKHKKGPGVFGHCQAYYAMVEAQGRGNPSPQVLRDRLAEEDGFQEKMFAWLESIIIETGPQDAKKPAPPQIAELDSESFALEFRDFLTRLAIECNWHHIRSGEKRGDDNCRMRLDGSLQASGSIELRRWRGRINNYTDLILFLFQSNTDTQFIGSGEAAKAAVFYITEYITKGNYATKMHNQNLGDSEDVDAERKNRNLITKSVNAMMSQQEISHQQVMSYLVGGGDYYTSHTFQTVKWYEFVRAADRIEQEADSDELVETQLEDDAAGSICEEQVTSAQLRNAMLCLLMTQLKMTTLMMTML